MLKVTKHTIRCDLVKGFNHLVRSGLVRGLQETSSRNTTLLEDLQIAVKPTWLRDFRSLLQWLESNNELTGFDATDFLITNLYYSLHMILLD